MNDKRKNQMNYRKGISFDSNKEKEKNFSKSKKENYIFCKGVVIKSFSNARFLVEIDNVGNQINATLAGKLRQNYIKILVGDRVELELSIYDMTQGRILRRI